MALSKHLFGRAGTDARVSGSAIKKGKEGGRDPLEPPHERRVPIE